MDKYDLLFIRAVKSGSNEFRTKRLYKKFYCSEFKTFHLAQILTNIVERNNMSSPREMVDAFNPDNAWMYEQFGNTYHDKVVSIMMQFIWKTPTSKIAGYIRPACFRNRQK